MPAKQPSPPTSICGRKRSFSSPETQQKHLKAVPVPSMHGFAVPNQNNNSNFSFTEENCDNSSKRQRSDSVGTESTTEVAHPFEMEHENAEQTTTSIQESYQPTQSFQNSNVVANYVSPFAEQIKADGLRNNGGPTSNNPINDDPMSGAKNTTSLCYVVIANRVNVFTKDNFWLVDQSLPQSLTQGATPLVTRCMNAYSWDLIFTLRVLKGYRQFLELANAANDWTGNTLTPPSLIEQMWRLHMEDLLGYCHDCMVLFGCVLGRNVYENPSSELYQKRRAETLERLWATHGERYDEDIWSYNNAYEIATDSDNSPPQAFQRHFNGPRSPTSLQSPELPENTDIDSAPLMLRMDSYPAEEGQEDAVSNLLQERVFHNHPVSDRRHSFDDNYDIMNDDLIFDSKGHAIEDYDSLLFDFGSMPMDMHNQDQVSGTISIDMQNQDQICGSTSMDKENKEQVSGTASLNIQNQEQVGNTASYDKDDQFNNSDINASSSNVHDCGRESENCDAINEESKRAHLDNEKESMEQRKVESDAKLPERTINSLDTSTVVSDSKSDDKRALHTQTGKRATRTSRTRESISKPHAPTTTKSKKSDTAKRSQLKVDTTKRIARRLRRRKKNKDFRYKPS